MWLLIPLGGVALVIVGIVMFVLWRDARERGGFSGDLPWGSRRRAVTATLEVATEGSAPLSTPTPTMRPPGNDSFLERLLDPFVRSQASVVRRLSPASYVESVSHRLTISGRGRRIDVDRFLAGRLATIALIPVAFIAIQLSPLPKFYRLLAFLLALFLLVLGPEAQLNRQAEARQERIRLDLPGLVDLLMISVEAGLAFDQALARATTATKGPLTEEFSRFVGEVRMGSDRVTSLEAIDERTDVAELRSFLMALIQADTFGVSIGPILRAQAQDLRVAQRQHVQELAQKAPVKMLFPMVFCVMPALLIVVAGPAAIEIYDTVIKHGLL